MIYFVGAGPGDPELITIKGRKTLEQADVVVYAGSLVSDEHIAYCKKGCEKHNSASMNLEEVIDVMIEAAQAGKMVVRLHTGDPSLFGAIKEQMDILDQHSIEYKVIPGVSSFTASAAALKKQFTLPGVSQTVILTRIAGRTEVPQEESLELLAAHKSSMAIFLSVNQIDEVVKSLLRGGYNLNTPCAVVYKATWEDEKIIKGRLETIANLVKEQGVDRWAQILVGDFLDTDYEQSKLYDKTFQHMFREAKE